MQRLLVRLLPLTVLVCALSPRVAAQTVAYTDQGAYLAALAAQGLATVHEGFEDDADWGPVRSTISGGQQTAPSITAQGVTWTGSFAGGEVTTGPGPVRTGQYGFFQLPHGDPATGQVDGWTGTTTLPLVAIGGWIETNTPYAGITLTIDGVPVNFPGSNVLTTQHAFFGVIDPAGFTQFEFRETEAQPGDWKYIYADDFTFAFGGAIVDCNGNGLGDGLDIASGTSTDCDGDGIPDECQLAATSTAPGGPFHCTSGCGSDCNANGVLDSCELVQPHVTPSGPLGPVASNVPLDFFVPSTPAPLGDVTLDVTAYANVGGLDEYIDVTLNGVALGRLFQYDGVDCADTTPNVARLTIPRTQFESLVNPTSATFVLLPSPEVDPDDCDFPSWIEVQLNVPIASSLDADQDGALDACQSLGAPYCAAAPNSASASGAHMSAFGSLTVPENDLHLQVESVPPGEFGLHFFGPAQASVPAGDGLRCVGGSLVRLPVVQATVAGAATTDVDLTSPFASTVLGGTTHYFQFWYRDPSGGPSGYNFSDGLAVTFF